MEIQIKIPQILQHLTGDHESVEVSGTTVRECVNDLIRQFPASGEWFDPGKPIIWIVLNQGLVNLTDLDVHICENDELSLIMVIGGG